MVSVWLVVDLDSKEGRQLAAAAVKHVKSSNQVEEKLRVYIFISITAPPRHRVNFSSNEHRDGGRGGAHFTPFLMQFSPLRKNFNKL